MSSVAKPADRRDDVAQAQRIDQLDDDQAEQHAAPADERRPTNRDSSPAAGRRCTSACTRAPGVQAERQHDQREGGPVERPIAEQEPADRAIRNARTYSAPPKQNGETWLKYASRYGCLRLPQRRPELRDKVVVLHNLAIELGGVRLLVRDEHFVEAQSFARRARLPGLLLQIGVDRSDADRRCQ